MQEIIGKSEAIVSYDPAAMGGDLSIVLVCEKQMVTIIQDFQNPVSFPRYRVLYSQDLKNLEYHKQVEILTDIVKKVQVIYNQNPVVLMDSTGAEGLADTVRQAIPWIYLIKFSGENMIREKSHVGRFTVLNKPVWVQKLALLLEQNQVIIDEDMPSAREIKKQLEQFTANIRKSGSVGYEAKPGNDDYISCLLETISYSPGIRAIPSFFNPIELVRG